MTARTAGLDDFNYGWLEGVLEWGWVAEARLMNPPGMPGIATHQSVIGYGLGSLASSNVARDL